MCAGVREDVRFEEISLLDIYLPGCFQPLPDHPPPHPPHSLSFLGAAAHCAFFMILHFTSRLSLGQPVLKAMPSPVWHWIQRNQENGYVLVWADVSGSNHVPLVMLEKAGWCSKVAQT